VVKRGKNSSYNMRRSSRGKPSREARGYVIVGEDIGSGEKGATVG
jgi:hypothetical protein